MARLLLGLVLALAAASAITATAPRYAPFDAIHAYAYDAPIDGVDATHIVADACATPISNTRTIASAVRSSLRTSPGAVRLVSGFFLAAKEVDDGFVYLRTDKLGGKPYVGQAKSSGRYKTRQTEHGRENPFADFDYDILGRAKPGTELDRLEEFFIRRHGGPTTKRNPNSPLANKRHQMSESRYEEAGGDFP